MPELDPPTVFMSYAHTDNVKLVGSEQGWVDRIYECLDLELQQLGLEFKFWRDKRDLEKDSFFDEAILDAVKDSQVLVAILSPVYTNRPYCIKEFNHFVNNANGGPPDSARHVIKVLKQPVDAESHKITALPEFVDLSIGFSFFAIDREDDKIIHFVQRDGNIVRDTEFWDTIQGLGDAVSRRLKKTLSANANQLQAANESFSGKTVFLSESSSDMDSTVRSVKSQLTALGCKVLPETRLSAREDEAIRTIRTHIEASDFSIHILGKRSGFVPDGDSGRSITEIQLDVAHRHMNKCPNFRRLLWIDPDVNQFEKRQQSIIDQLNNGQLLHKNDDLVIEPLELFKDSISDAVKFDPSGNDPANFATGQNGNIRSIFLVYDHCDIELGGELRRELFNRGAEVFRPDYSNSQTIDDADLNSLMAASSTIIVVYGDTNEAWVQQTLLRLRRLSSNRDNHQPKILVLLSGATDQMKTDFLTRLAEKVLDATGDDAESVLDSLLSL